MLQSLAGLSFYNEGLFKQTEISILNQIDKFQPEHLAQIISAFVSPFSHS